MSCWQKAFCGTSQTTQPVVKAVACSPQTAGEDLIAGNSPDTTHWTWRSWVGVCLEPSLYWLVSRLQTALSLLPKEKQLPAQLQIFSSTVVSFLQVLLVQWWHKLVGVTNTYLIWFKVCFIRWDPYPNALGWPRTCDYSVQSARGKPNIGVL